MARLVVSLALLLLLFLLLFLLLMLLVLLMAPAWLPLPPPIQVPTFSAMLAPALEFVLGKWFFTDQSAPAGPFFSSSASASFLIMRPMVGWWPLLPPLPPVPPLTSMLVDSDCPKSMTAITVVRMAPRCSLHFARPLLPPPHGNRTDQGIFMAVEEFRSLTRFAC